MGQSPITGTENPLKGHHSNRSGNIRSKSFKTSLPIGVFSKFQPPDAGRARDLAGLTKVKFHANRIWATWTLRYALQKPHRHRI
jgi:hypothetical protein